MLVHRVGSGGVEGRGPEVLGAPARDSRRSGPRFSALRPAIPEVGVWRFGDWASGGRRILLEIFGEAPRILLLIFGGYSGVAPAVSAVSGRWFGSRGPEEACE